MNTNKLLSLIVQHCNTIDDITSLLEKTINSLIEISSSERGFFFILDDKKELSLKVARNKDEKNIISELLLDRRLDFSKNIIMEAINLKSSICVSNLLSSDSRFHLWSKYGYSETEFSKDLSSIMINKGATNQYSLPESAVAVPIIRKNDTLGAFYLEKQNSSFCEDELNTLESVAFYLAEKISNIQLEKKFNETYKELKRKIWDISILFDMSRNLSSSLNTDSILKNLLFTSMGSMGIEFGAVMLMDESKNELSFKASSGLSQDVIKQTKLYVDDAFVKLVRKGDPIIIDEIMPEDDVYPTIKILKKMEMALCIPMVKDNHLKGLLTLGKKARGKSFTSDEIGILLSLANQALVTLENAKLYEEVSENEKSMKRKVAQLSILHKVGQTLSSVLDLNKLLEIIYEESSKIVNTSCFSITLYDEKTQELSYEIEVDENIRYPKRKRKMGLGLESWVIQSTSPFLARDLNKERAKLPVEPSLSRSGKMPNSWLGVPLTLKDRVLGVISVQSDNPDAFTEDDLQILSTLASHAAIAIENARLYEEVAEKERIAQELKIANHMQKALLPSSPPQIEGFDIYATTIPATSVGGDFYDYITIGNGLLGLCVGDVSGKGIGAALYMAVTNSVIQAKAVSEEHPMNVLYQANQVLCKRVTDKSVVVAYTVLDTNKRIIRLTNSGLISPLYYSSLTNTCEFIKISGMPLGITKKGKYTEKELQLNQGDIIVLCSDGIIEAMNMERKMFGADRYTNVITKNHSMSSAQIVSKLLDEVYDFTAGAPQHDDITVLVLKVL